mgnify:FL=1|tara:strand:- start:189 stop:506 length:318 start_codon:yes stop_codon:yes gene_type:complete
MSNQKESTEESTEERITEALQMIAGAREDVEKYWTGDKHAREAIDLQLSIAESRVDILTNLINLKVIEARYDGLRAGLERGLEIHNEAYGSLGEQLQAGEGNLSQ